MAENHFSDINLGSLGAGSLSGLGADDHYSSTSKMTPDGSGMSFEVVCDPCGNRQEVLVSWDELIFVSVGIPAPGNPNSPPWAYDQRHGALYPDVGCANCGRKETRCLLTPDEAQRHLKAGVQAGRINSQYINSSAEQARRMVRR